MKNTTAPIASTWQSQPRIHKTAESAAAGSTAGTLPEAAAPPAAVFVALHAVAEDLRAASGSIWTLAAGAHESERHGDALDLDIGNTRAAAFPECLPDLQGLHQGKAGSADPLHGLGMVLAADGAHEPFAAAGDAGVNRYIIDGQVDARDEPRRTGSLPELRTVELERLSHSNATDRCALLATSVLVLTPAHLSDPEHGFAARVGFVIAPAAPQGGGYRMADFGTVTHEKGYSIVDAEA